MARKTSKICLVCGEEFLGTDGKMTCKDACRSAMSRMVAKGKKPEYWVIAKSKGQKIPLFFPKPKKKDKQERIETKINYKENTKESYDAEPLSFLTMDEVGQTAPFLTKEQIAIEVTKLEGQIKTVKMEKCPMNKHPKMFILEQEVKEAELQDKIDKLTATH